MAADLEIPLPAEAMRHRQITGHKFHNEDQLQPPLLLLQQAVAGRVLAIERLVVQSQLMSLLLQQAAAKWRPLAAATRLVDRLQQ